MKLGAVQEVTAIFIICFLSVQCISKLHFESPSRTDAKHFVDDLERHDAQFDHNAFLGNDRAEEFAQLTTEQSHGKLKQIIKRIDKNGDGKISQSELNDWITHVTKSSSEKMTDRRWSDINPNKKESIEWEEYRETTYGPEADRLSDPATAEHYKQAVRLDERRWKTADLDRDDELSVKEFDVFLHPEQHAHMKEIMIDELLDVVDKDADGRVSKQEYLDDIIRSYKYPVKPGEPEPDWLVREREQFVTYRDSDGDGMLSRAEVSQWIMPKNYDPVDAEVQHLFHYADSNQDKELTETEIMDRQDLFVSSHATDYGSALHSHEEF